MSVPIEHALYRLRRTRRDGIPPKHYRGTWVLSDDRTKQVLATCELIGVVTILHDKAEALERERLYVQFSQPLWLDVYKRRPIGPLVTREPMVVDAAMPIEGVKELIAYRYPQAISSGFAIVEHNR